MRITKPKRSRGGAKRLDLTDMRELFKDRRMWGAIGIVTTPEGAAQHWEIVSEDGATVDVLVEVVLQPSENPVTCRLSAGIFDVPDEGDEVGVLIPEGETDFMPVIVCRLSTNSVPTVQGPQPGRIVICRDEVIVHDGDGGAVSLALKSDVSDLATHVDTLPVGGSGSAPSIPGTAPQPTGTTVLLGK